MQLSCDRALFSAAFSVAASAVPSRTPKDVLRNVFLSVKSNGVELVGTDQEMAIRYRVEGVTTNSSGDALLPTQRVNSILRELQDETLDIDVNERMIMLKSLSATFRLTSDDPNEFPPVPEFAETDFFRIPAAVFRQMVRRTSFATDTESTRYALGGVLIEFRDDVVTLAATDSRRLAVATAAYEAQGTPGAPEKATVIPAKAMSLLERSIGNSDEFVDIVLHENDVMMRTGACVVYSRLVEGRFPRYRDVIPASGAVNVPVPVAPFLAAVRQSQIVTDEESRGVDFHFGNSMLTLSSQANDVGESKVELPIEYEHEEIRITFDPRYVSEFLRVLSPETLVDLQLTDSETAAVFRVEDSYTYVIMPLSRDS
ncbi:MAG: DNA polymerase III subunit beta [Planctomycetaceae bacterium]|nr:DNA polymerase III subunit beta [Planctomycetaceae bacterium]